MHFDHNQMQELAALKAERYQRNGGGGTHVVYKTAKAYYDAHGWKELSPWRQACIEAIERYRVAAAIACEHYRVEILTSKDGFYHGDSIPF